MLNLFAHIVLPHTKKMKEELEKQKAYQLGFYDGFTVGVENNTFTDDMDRHLYRLGYDAGVAEYCWDQDKIFN